MTCGFCHSDKPKKHNIRTCPAFTRHYAKELAIAGSGVDATEIAKKVLMNMGVPGTSIFFAAKAVYDKWSQISSLSRMSKTQRNIELVLICIDVAKSSVRLVGARAGVPR